MIKLAIVGYGKMGKEVESLIGGSEFSLIGKYDIDNPVQENMVEYPDVAIEFSTPSTVIRNVEYLASKKINVVCGTTGWYGRTDEMRSIISRFDTGFVYASNFSVGMNIFFQVVKAAAEQIDKYGQYGVSVEETHHTQKLDKPSGTALRIAEYLIGKIGRKNEAVNDKEGVLNDNELNIISKRTGNVTGNHKVIFDSPADSIILEHDAKSRRGFAEGALLAARFIHNKKGFFKFEEIFNKLI